MNSTKVIKVSFKPACPKCKSDNLYLAYADFHIARYCCRNCEKYFDTIDAIPHDPKIRRKLAKIMALAQEINHGTE